MLPRELLDAYLLAISANAAAHHACRQSHLRVEHAWDSLRLATTHLRDDLMASGPIVDARSGVMFTAHDEVTGIESKPIRII